MALSWKNYGEVNIPSSENSSYCNNHYDIASDYLLSVTYIYILVHCILYIVSICVALHERLKNNFFNEGYLMVCIYCIVIDRKIVR